MPSVFVTRPANQAEPLKTELERLGFDVWHQPAIEILPPENWGAVDAVIRRLAGSDARKSFDWLVFFSANSVNFFFDRMTQVWEEPPLVPVKIAVAGKETANCLKRRSGWQADLLPSVFTADALAEQLLDEARHGKRFLVLRASRGRNVLRKCLEAAGGTVTEVAVYRSVDVEEPRPEIVEAMHDSRIDFTTVTSSAIACSLVRQFGKELAKTRLVSISPITSQTLIGLGFRPQFEASEASMKGIVDVFQRIT